MKNTFFQLNNTLIFFYKHTVSISIIRLKILLKNNRKNNGTIEKNTTIKNISIKEAEKFFLPAYKKNECISCLRIYFYKQVIVKTVIFHPYIQHYQKHLHFHQPNPIFLKVVVHTSSHSKTHSSSRSFPFSSF